MLLKVLLVDDEVKSCEVLSKILLNYCADVTVVGMAHNITEAHDLILQTNPDLVFLDVQMPGGDGFSLLEKFDNINFHIVFVTAFDQFAIKAIKFSALDYLLKPVNIDEVIESVNKFKKDRMINEHAIKDHTLLQNLLKNVIYPGKKIWDTIALPTAQAILYVKLDEIIYVEADNNYSVFYLESKEKIMVSYTLKTYEELLCEQHFMRVHNSHIINLHKVKKFIRGKNGYAEMSNGKQIEVSPRKKDEFLGKYGS
jgi:two-component system LytT family response regulator